MHPVMNCFFTECSSGLGYLAFMMRKHKIHSTSVNIKLFTKIFDTHGRTFQVPSGETITPWRWPSHKVIRAGLFPDSKIEWISFFITAFDITGVTDEVI